MAEAAAGAAGGQEMGKRAGSGGCQGTGTEKQSACREGSLSRVSAIYSAILLLPIMCNIWHVIITYNVQYTARMSLPSLWSAPAERGCGQ